ncbi:uncharacterized protein VNE69_06181 [Vairimorpha necatrix]|uniref:Uncharacterized protein n=1 Tax=Vairimorpha necatrix TaxID=6039 RepID=A0AAX4JD34_9MICR
MLHNSSEFDCSYLKISPKITTNKDKKIKKDLKDKNVKQSLSVEERNKVYEISNRDLLGSKCEKVDLKEYYLGKYI